jgi:hypothetical protein
MKESSDKIMEDLILECMLKMEGHLIRKLILLNLANLIR